MDEFNFSKAQEGEHIVHASTIKDGKRVQVRHLALKGIKCGHKLVGLYCTFNPSSDCHVRRMTKAEIAQFEETRAKLSYELCPET